MGSKSKYIHHSANYYAVKKAEQNEQLHIPGYQLNDEEKAVISTIMMRNVGFTINEGD